MKAKKQAANKETQPEGDPEFVAMSDEILFDELREQVTRSRNRMGYNGARMRKIAAEMDRRGWKVHKPSKDAGTL